MHIPKKVCLKFAYWIKNYEYLVKNYSKSAFIIHIKSSSETFTNLIISTTIAIIMLRLKHIKTYGAEEGTIFIACYCNGYTGIVCF